MAKIRRGERLIEEEPPTQKVPVYGPMCKREAANRLAAMKKWDQVADDLSDHPAPLKRPYLSITDKKKRFGGFGFIFKEIRSVIGFD